VLTCFVRTVTTLRYYAAIAATVAATMPAVVHAREMIVRHSGKCLEIGGPTWSAVFQHTCVPGSVSQGWRRGDDDGGYFALTAERTGGCLRATRVTAVAGWTAVSIGACDGSTDQEWHRVPAGYGFFGVGDRAGRGCLDVLGSSVADWTTAVLAPCEKGRLSQQWHSALFGNSAPSAKITFSGDNNTSA
jgi:Ricin-type beta-trefoil lectin domain